MRFLRRFRAPTEGEARKGDLTTPREDARTYVLCGDNVWGCSITWTHRPGEHPKHPGDGTFATAHGWLPNPLPERGDVLVAPMGGGAGRFVVQSVERWGGVDDAFTAELRGVIDYLDPPPKFESARELLQPSPRSDGRAEFV
jgi:hypothetical protein